MDVAATDVLLGDFIMVDCGDATAEDTDSRKDRDERARIRWAAESGFKNVFVTTLVMLPYRLQDLYDTMGTRYMFPTLAWYMALAAYFTRRWFMAGGPSVVRKTVEGIFVGSPGDDADTMWLIMLQVLWASLGQVWYAFSSVDLSFVTPTLMLMAVHIPRHFFFGILVPLNATVILVRGFDLGSSSVDITAMQCLLQAAFVSFVVLMREEAAKKHYHSRLASERGRMEVMRAQLQAEAQRATFRGMLDSVFDASCICSRDGTIVSSTPQMDAILLGQRAAGANGSGLLGKRLTDFANGQAEKDRATYFLHDVANCTTARRIHTSLVRPNGDGASVATIEVTVSGITVPTDEATAQMDDMRQLFVGFQVDAGILALEAEEVGEEAMTATAAPTLSCMRPESDSTETDPAVISKADGQDVLEDGLSVDDSVISVRLQGRGAARSICSAPPVLQCLAGGVQRVGEQRVDASSDECGGEQGDCLPGDALVRVEGKAKPVRVEAVELGQRVLCLDHLSGALKYAEVVEVEVRQEAHPDLVEVVLEDGTEVQMTFDHPVFTDFGMHVRAGELQPSVHKLDVVKVTSVLVKDVRRVSQDAPSTAIVSLSVNQPQRHSFFIDGSVGGAVGQSVAVASSSMTSPEERVPLELRLRHTFLECVEEASTPTRRRRRSSSLPPRRYAAAASEAAAAEPPQPSTGGSEAPVVVVAVPPRQPLLSSRASEASCVSSSLGSLPVSSRMSAVTSDGEDIVIMLAKSVEDRRVRGWTALGHAKVSDVVEVKRAGLRSIGSRGHEEGWCYPCLMENWHNPDRPCIFGIGCSRCHEHHSKRQFKKARYSKPHATKFCELPEPACVGRVA